MAAPTNADVSQRFAQIGTPFTLYDNQVASFATAAGAQAQGLRANGEVVRVVTSVATGAVVLPSLTNNEAPGIIIIVNDSPNSINVGGAAGDKMNTVATTSTFGAGVVAVAAATSAVFVASGSPLGVGGVATVAPNNWHGVAFP